MPPRMNLVGHKYRKLTVIKYTKHRGKHVIWECVCDCGKITFASTTALRQDHIGSCGCSRIKLPPGEGGLRSLLVRYKSGARNRKLEFSISEEDFRRIILGDCSYCGLPPTAIEPAKGYGNVKYTGIDRIDPSRGYTLDNCTSCCGTCNRLKMALTKDEFINQVAKIAKNLKL